MKIKCIYRLEMINKMIWNWKKMKVKCIYRLEIINKIKINCKCQLEIISKFKADIWKSVTLKASWRSIESKFDDQVGKSESIDFIQISSVIQIPLAQPEENVENTNLIIVEMITAVISISVFVWICGFISLSVIICMSHYISHCHWIHHFLFLHLCVRPILNM